MSLTSMKPRAVLVRHGPAARGDRRADVALAKISRPTTGTVEDLDKIPVLTEVYW